MQQFRQTTQLALQKFINNRIKGRLDQVESLEQQTSPVTEQREEPGGHGIVTTKEELEGYYIVKAILRETIGMKRVVMRDMVTQCAVLLDNTLRKPICRFHFDSSQMYLGLIDEEKREERIPIETVDDIYQYAGRLKDTVGFYDKGVPAGDA